VCDPRVCSYRQGVGTQAATSPSELTFPFSVDFRAVNRPPRGVAVAVAGLTLFVGTLVVGAAAAPTIELTDGETGPTLVGSQGGGTGWHEQGRVYRVENASVNWSESGADSYFDVTELPDGTVLAGFMHSGYTEGCGPYDPPCTKTGAQVIDPRAAGGPTVVREHAFPVRTPANSETHDVERLATGELLLSDMEHERIFTVRNGSVTWEWSASAFYDAPPDPSKRDWLHINDVDAVNETHYLVSVRNANQILLIERGVGVVTVINEDRGTGDAACQLGGNQLADFDGDGEIRCGDPAVMDHQHNPQWLGDGAVLVADSGNDRVVELHREDGRWAPVWTLTEAAGVPLHWPRDADRLPDGNTLVTDTLNKRLFEVTPNGTVVWSMQTPEASPIAYEADRLPSGERVGAPSYQTETTGGDSGDVPVLSSLLVGLHSVAPTTPFWFSERHLALSLLGLLGVGLGAVDWYRNRGP